jgi:hypothetical protein
MNCRHCKTPLIHTFLDLGFAPPSNAYLTSFDLTKPEKYYPLKVMICDKCWLVQTEDYAQAEELFDSEYAYFSSTSIGWLEHAKAYAENMIDRLSLSKESLVIEVASNDGYLLKNFVANQIPCLGIEPTASTGEVAKAMGIPVLREFFGEQLGLDLAAKGKRADLIAGNNVYAHVPDINDFTKGLKAALKSNGTITLEFPHLLRLIESTQFDTIYHEHFSYLSLFTTTNIFESAGLKIFDVEELPTHGGSLRIYACHDEDPRSISIAVEDLLNREVLAGVNRLDLYRDFQAKANRAKDDLLYFLLEQKKKGKTVAAYGAAAKGNTLLNYAGIKPDLISFVCDAAIAKQNKFLPGSHIPVYEPAYLYSSEVDFIIIFPWNIAIEIIKQLSEKINTPSKFVTAIPSLIIHD